MKKEIKKKEENTRPPIVVVMGHIDHGKTTLLDQIRKARVAEKETGGITQHIGAYQVLSNDKKITFIDTPGHEAFSQMRCRGAKVADIAVLVIDSCEGVKPQTKEVIKHIKESGVSIIVALNKIDKPESNPEKVKRELVKEEVLTESMGGKVLCAEISAKTGKGVPELLELILLVAEMEELKADFQKPGEGVVIESFLDSSRGPTATLLLTEGHLKTGEVVGLPSGYTKIKNLEDFQKRPIQEAFASDPVVVFGFSQVPGTGECFKVFSSAEEAEGHDWQIENKKEEIKEEEDGKRTLNIILKADVAGSLEAVEGILKTIPQENISLRILESGVGNISESDMRFTRNNRVLVFGFRVKVDSAAKMIAERNKAKIMLFDVIYNLVEEVRKCMERIIESKNVRLDLGKMRVLAKFLDDKNRQIIGGRVTEGEIRRGASIEVLRDDEMIGKGKMINLQRNKKDAGLISKGEECGILYEGDVKVEEGDTLVFYLEEKRKGEL